ncbi:MAG: hypothetical protein LR015_05225 [Verrucomicrobia bacterium]|nr:hypothetical protein [Verrucomicrobiota bacterium]
MPKRKGKFALLYRFTDWLLGHPSRIFEVFLALVLSYLAAGAVFHFGGLQSYGTWFPQVINGLVAATLLFLAVIWLRKEPLPIYWQLCLPLPFLLWATASLLFGNGSPWAGGATVGLLLGTLPNVHFRCLRIKSPRALVPDLLGGAGGLAVGPHHSIFSILFSARLVTVGSS